MKKFLCFVFLLACFGCVKQKPVIIEKNNWAYEKIAAVADEVHEDIISIKEISSEKKVKKREPEIAFPQVFSEKITLDWFGPVDPLLEVIASKLGYQTKIIGNLNRQEESIVLNAVDVPIKDVLEDIGWQLGEKIGLQIDITKKQIILKR